MRSLVALLISIGVTAAAFAQAPAPATDRAAIEAIVRDVIRNNPELVIEALESYDRKRKEAETSRAREMLAANREALRNDPNSEVAGDPRGDVTVVAFFDYRCPYCKQAHGEIQSLVRRDPKVRVVLKELPILGPDSVLASRAAIASRLQGKYLPFHAAMLETRALNETVIFRLAADVGLNVERLKADMQRPEIETIIAANLKLAHALGIDGTPAFVVADKLLPGVIPVEALAGLVRDARDTCKTSC